FSFLRTPRTNGRRVSRQLTLIFLGYWILRSELSLALVSNTRVEVMPSTTSILTRATPNRTTRIPACRSGPNDANSATRPAGRVDCNQSARAGFAAAHG